MRMVVSIFVYLSPPRTPPPPPPPPQNCRTLLIFMVAVFSLELVSRQSPASAAVLAAKVEVVDAISV